MKATSDWASFVVFCKYWSINGLYLCMFMVPYAYCVESLCGVHLATRVAVSLLCDHDRRRTSIIHSLTHRAELLPSATAHGIFASIPPPARPNSPPPTFLTYLNRSVSTSLVLPPRFSIFKRATSPSPPSGPCPTRVSRCLKALVPLH